MRSATLPAALMALLVAVFSANVSLAEILQAPIGGKAIPLGNDRVICGAPSAGWSMGPDAHRVTPPNIDDAVGTSVDVAVAPTVEGCATSKASLTLVATGRWPAIDAAGALLAVDDARLELRGKRLRGLHVTTRAGSKSTDDVCLDPKADGANERCVLTAGRGLPADPASVSATWLPAGARAGAAVTTFNADGRAASAADFGLAIARITIASLLPAGASVDFTSGARRVALIHPEAVTSVDCNPASCMIEDGGIAVTGLSAASTPITVRFKLLPHVALARGDALDAAPTASIPVLQCPLAVISGPPLRGVDDSRMVVSLSGACARDARTLRFRVGDTRVDALRVVLDGDAANVVLRAGRLDDDAITIAAMRPEPDISIVAATHVSTRAMDPPRATLELPQRGPIDFIPTNGSAWVRVSGVGEHTKLVLLPIAGVYEATVVEGLPAVRAVPSAAGFVSLRFAYRSDNLPPALGDVDLGFASEPVERPLRAANIPAPFGASALGPHSLVEVLCNAEGKTLLVKPGDPIHIPFDARDGCRLVFHRDRLSSEYGTQRLTLEMSVTRVGGESRPDAHVTEPLVLRPGGDPRVVWIRGVVAPFDRVSVRLSHSSDETHYVLGDDIPGLAPSAQWAVIMGKSRARLYATTAIPTGLYRVSDRDHSGILTLNFGVLGRLTWLDGDGAEGPLGLELGMLGVGLANDTSATGRSLTQVATVLGAGLGVPIANRGSATETSINLHAWAEFEPSRALGGGGGDSFGFVFGPSITIGNIGTNL